jgi:hypothetical protein
MSPVSRQIQPESIEERIALYERRTECEAAGLSYAFTKNRFLNWRLHSGTLKIRRQVIPAHILPYSTLKKSYTRGRIEYAIGVVHYLSRDEVKFITRAHYNQLADTVYGSVVDLMFSPPLFDVELKVRQALLSSPYDLSALLVVETIPENKIELTLETTVWEDVRESLVVFD